MKTLWFVMLIFIFPQHIHCGMLSGTPVKFFRDFIRDKDLDNILVIHEGGRMIEAVVTKLYVILQVWEML